MLSEIHKIISYAQEENLSRPICHVAMWPLRYDASMVFRWYIRTRLCRRLLVDPCRSHSACPLTVRIANNLPVSSFTSTMPSMTPTTTIILLLFAVNVLYVAFSVAHMTRMQLPPLLSSAQVKVVASACAVICICKSVGK